MRRGKGWLGKMLPILFNVSGSIKMGKVTASQIDSESATDGQVLTADGSGGAAWEDATGGGGGAFAFDGIAFNITKSEVAEEWTVTASPTLDGDPIAEDVFAEIFLTATYPDGGGGTFWVYFVPSNYCGCSIEDTVSNVQDAGDQTNPLSSFYPTFMRNGIDVNILVIPRIETLQSGYGNGTYTFYINVTLPSGKIIKSTGMSTVISS